MEWSLIIIFIVYAIVKATGKNKDAKKEESGRSASSALFSAASRPRPAQAASEQATKAPSSSGSFPRSPYIRSGSANISRDGRVYASIDFDNTHYHAEGFDFDSCISFKGLPQGTDELAVLIASNNRHERELSKLLQVREG